MSRSAWDLDSRPEVDWRTRGACAPPADPDPWSSKDRIELGRARWLCRNACPVRAECLAWAERKPQQVADTVAGGVLWTRRKNSTEVRRSPYQPQPISPDHVLLPPPTYTRLLYRIDEIRAMVAAGMSNRAIADRLEAPTDSVRNFLYRHQIRRHR